MRRMSIVGVALVVTLLSLTTLAGTAALAS